MTEIRIKIRDEKEDVLLSELEELIDDLHKLKEEHNGGFPIPYKKYKTYDAPYIMTINECEEITPQEYEEWESTDANVMHRSCKWEYLHDIDTHETECGGLFTINDGTPKENDMIFCPYCGGKILDTTKGA